MEPFPPERKRAGDQDREEIVELLRAACTEGRLGVAEYDERVQRAFAAATYGELHELTVDLPPPTTQPEKRRQQPQPQRKTDPKRTSHWPSRGPAAAWFYITFLNFAVWLVLVVNNGINQVHPWWLWIAAGGGGVLLGGKLIERKRRGPPELPGEQTDG